MSGIIVSGDTSGSVTLSAPAVAGTVTVTLPSTTGTMLTTASATGISGSAISSGTVPEAYGGTGTSTGYYGFKNRIINGGMVIDQRNAGASVTPTVTGTYTLDRWGTGLSQASKFSVQQVTTAPSGFGFSLKVTSLSAYTVGAAEGFRVSQAIEGFNMADLAWGTASASSVTLSFKVYSSLTGTFGGSIVNQNADYSFPFSYSIPVANTWTTITVNVSGPTSGTWTGATNGVGLYLLFSLGSGATVSGTAGAWAATTYLSATGATSVVGTSGATFYITGVQLEKGSTATSFDYRPYGTELALCQRYLPSLDIPTGGSVGTGYSYNSTQSLYTITFSGTARVSPTGISTSGTFSALIGNATGPVTISSVVFSNGGSLQNCEVVATGTASFTVGQGAQLRASGACKILFTGCEL